MKRTREKHNEYNRVWASNNREKANGYYKKWKKRRNDWYFSLKKGLSCSNCGENDPRCLEYHHPDRTTKSDSVGNMFNTKVNKNTILTEISKCIVLCANCHRKVHQ